MDQILAEEAVDGGTPDLVQWTLTDHLNTVRDIAKYDPGSEMTTVVNHLIYDAFGRMTSESNPAVDSLFLFTARPFDQDTQLQNNLNRWYDARVGRWLSEDPIGFNGGDGNLYRYVENNVLLVTDPLGLYSGITGPCEIKIWMGDTLFSKASLQNFLNNNRDPGNHPLCPSKYLGVVGCGRFVPDISADQQIPGYGGPPELLHASKFMEVANAVLRAAEKLASQLCENRRKFCDDGTPERYECGAKNQRCDSVTITVTYDRYVSRLLNEGIAPDGSRVFGLPNSESRELLRRLNKLMRWPKTINCLH
ncbi:RHS repeat domain-containing protein [Thermopirellula anaerolimosa]